MEKTRITANKLIESASVNFMVSDSKGRTIGCNWAIGAVTAELIDQNAMTWSRLAPGEHFYFQGQPSRDGKDFGAWQRKKYFSTIEAAREAKDKHLAAAGKRAMKK